MTNQELLYEACTGKIRVVNADALSYFKNEGRAFESEFVRSKFKFQLAMFDWLSWPEMGTFGCPFKAGGFFSTKMRSGKTGIWLVVSEAHDYRNECGQLIAYFCGYNDGTIFYTEENLSVMIASYRKMMENHGWKFNSSYTVHTEI